MKKILLITIALLFACSAQASTTYCTTKNWNKVTSYYKKYEAKLNESIDKLNTEIDEKSYFDFFHDNYSVEQIAELWARKQNSITTALNEQHRITSVKVDELTELRSEFAAVKKKFITAKKNWEKIGDSCEDDGEWDNGRQASKNWKNADNALEVSIRSILKTERIRKAYRSDKKLIVAGYTLYKDNCGC